MEEKEELGCTGSCAGCSGCSSDENSSVITLTDENGKDVKFEVLDVVVLDEKQYLVVAEILENEISEEAVILEIKEVDGEEVYDTVVDEKIADEVFNKYMEAIDYDDEEENK